MCGDCCPCSNYVCGACNETYNRNETEGVYIDDDDCYYCEVCAKAETSSCIKCDDRYRDENLNDDEICVECRN